MPPSVSSPVVPVPDRPSSLPSWAPVAPGWQLRGVEGPRAHQCDDVPALAALLASPGARTQYRAACGTGKTLTGLWVMQQLNAARVVIGFPSLALIDQTMRQWADCADPARPLEMMALASQSGEDLKTSDCYRPASTNADEIARFWGAPLAPGARRVLFVCYRSVPRLTEVYAAHPALPAADLLICDEAHHLAGPVTKEAQALVFDDAVPADRRLFMTATPVCTPVDGDPVEGAMPAHAKRFIGMDQTAAFGSAEVRRGFRWAIEQGTLTDYTVVTPPPPSAQLSLVMDRFEQHNDLETLPRRQMPAGYWQKAFVVATEIGMNPDGARRILTFHQSCQHAKRFAAAVRLASRLLHLPRPYAANLNGEDRPEVRRQRLAALANARAGLVTSVNVLTEGVDAPAVDGVALIDAKQSVVSIAQAIGRCIRLDPTRPDKVARIIVPVYTDRRSGSAQMTPESQRALYGVLTALGESDDRLQAYGKGLREETGGLRAMRPEDRAFFEQRLSLGHAVALSDEERAALLTSLQTFVVKEFAHTFADYYEACREWLSRPGHTILDCPLGTMYGGLDIGRFLSSQRRRLRDDDERAHPSAASGITRPRMRPVDARRALLESLPGWTLDVEEAAFRRMAVRLAVWMQEHGDRMPEAKAADPLEKELWIWAKNQKAGQQAVTGENTQRTPLTARRREQILKYCPHFMFSETASEKAARKARDARDAELHKTMRIWHKLTPEQQRVATGLHADVAEVARRARDAKAKERQRAATVPVAATVTPEEQARWDRLREETERFVQRHKRAPAFDSASGEERRLGHWYRLEAIRATTPAMAMPPAQRRSFLLLELFVDEHRTQSDPTVPASGGGRLVVRA